MEIITLVFAAIAAIAGMIQLASWIVSIEGIHKFHIDNETFISFTINHGCPRLLSVSLHVDEGELCVPSIYQTLPERPKFSSDVDLGLVPAGGKSCSFFIRSTSASKRATLEARVRIFGHAIKCHSICIPTAKDSKKSESS